MPFDKEVAVRSIDHRGDVVKLRLPTPEDLVILRTIASWPQDPQDIHTVAEVILALDVECIEHCVAEYYCDLLNRKVSVCADA
jgi:hypothetical protein